MKSPEKWIPIALTLAVFPGMGHWYLRKRLRGMVFSGLTLLILLGAFARYMSVLFALANLQGPSRPLHASPWHLMAAAFRLDRYVLLAFLLALGVVWVLAFVDLTLHLKEGK